MSETRVAVAGSVICRKIQAHQWMGHYQILLTDLTNHSEGNAEEFTTIFQQFKALSIMSSIVHLLLTAVVFP